MPREIIKTPYYSWRIGALPKGCTQCVKGNKLVLFITGKCDNNCYYCPISEMKKNNDVIYANERPITRPSEAIDEARLCAAKGAGITGGDPLVQIARTRRYIRALKKAFGPSFHIHLYTPLIHVNHKNLKSLADAGLDEIRFHPSLTDESLWPRMLIAKEFPITAGVEIPALPDRRTITKRLIDFIDGKLTFININELEISDTNAQDLRKQGFVTKDKVSYGVKGSQTLARSLLRYALTKKLRSHYCTCTLKDKVQLTNRIQHRAKHIATPYDIITEDSTLLRLVAYPKNLLPGYGYSQHIASLTVQEQRNIHTMMHKAQKHLGQGSSYDRSSYRIILSEACLERNLDRFPDLNLVAAAVEEYPTYDHMIVELKFLTDKE